MSSFLQQILDFKNSSASAAFQTELAGIALLIIFSLIAGKMLLHFFSKNTRDKSPLVTMISLSIVRPLQLLVATVVLWTFFIFSERFLGSKMKSAEIITQEVLAIALLVAITWMFKRVADSVRDYLKKTKARTDGGYNDFSAIEAIHMAVIMFLYAISLITFLFIIGVSPTALAGLSVAGGIGAYALTMANQILISNIFAGLVLYLDRPFAPGDWIITQNGTLEGTVKRIGLRLTELTGFDQRPIYVPNSIFNSTPTINASRMTNRRIKQFVGVRYKDFSKVAQIISDIRDYLTDHAEIDNHRPIIVSLVNGSTTMGSTIEGCYGSSSINLQIYVYTNVTNWTRFQAVQDKIMLHVGEIVLDNDAQVAFPTRTIDMPAETVPSP